MKGRSSDAPWQEGRVLFFDENLGRGMIRLEETGRRVPFTYRDVVSEEGFITFHEGERVWVRLSGDRVEVRRWGLNSR